MGKILEINKDYLKFNFDDDMKIYDIEQFIICFTDEVKRSIEEKTVFYLTVGGKECNCTFISIDRQNVEYILRKKEKCIKTLNIDFIHFITQIIENIQEKYKTNNNEINRRLMATEYKIKTIKR